MSYINETQGMVQKTSPSVYVNMSGTLTVTFSQDKDGPWSYPVDSVFYQE